MCAGTSRERGGDPDAFSNGLATVWSYVTEDRRTARRILADVLAPLIGRSQEEVGALLLPVGSADLCAERLSEFAAAGAQRVLLWPLGDGVRQLELIAERVAPRIRAGDPPG